MDRAEDVRKLKGQHAELIWSGRVHVKNRWVTTITVSCTVRNSERRKHTSSFSGRRRHVRLNALDTNGLASTLSVWKRDCWQSPVASKCHIFPSTAVLRQFFYGTFSNPPIWIEGNLLYLCVGVYLLFFFFFNCTFKTWICFSLQQNKGGRQTERSVWDLSATNRDIFENRHFGAHHVPVISLSLSWCYPYSHVR